MKRNTISTIAFLLIGCAASQTGVLYTDEYIVMERRDSGYELDGQVYAQDETAKLLDALNVYPSKKLLLGKETEFQVNDLLNLGPALREGGFEIYYLDKDGNPKRADFL